MIVRMKKAHLVVLKEDKERLLQSLQKYGEMMLINTAEDGEIRDNADYSLQLQRIEKSLNDLKPYLEDKKNDKHLVIGYEEFMKNDPQRQELLEKIEHTNEEIARLQGENNSLLETLKFLQPWKDLNIRLSEISVPKYATLHTGFVELRNLKNFVQLLKDYGCELDLLGRANEGQALLFAAYYKDNDEILDKVKNLGYSELSLPAENKLVSELMANKQSLIDLNLERIKQLQKDLNQLSDDVSELQVLSDQIKSKAELEQAYAKATMTAVYLEGWVRSDRIDRFEKAIKETTDVYDLELTDPKPDEMPPTVTENNRFTEPFEVITDMFSKPNPNEIDPNPVMSIWYWILFGIMMGDAGYGLVMLLFSYLFIKFKKPKGGTLKIMRIFLISSITTIAWGVLFGSYFGATWDPLAELGRLIGQPGLHSIVLEPMKQPLPMLILSIAIGYLHILTGIVMKAIRNLLDGHYFDAFADQLSWLLILIGIIFIAVPYAPTKALAVPLVAVGVVIVVFTAGRHKKGIFGKAVGGILNLYSVTGYMSDVLSYSRILALALSSAVIAMVMNMLGGMVWGSIPVLGVILAIVIYLLGHTFNIGMGLLSAYVHDSRLQYIEFFGKFYDGGGYEFKPLSLNLKYVDKVNEK